MKNLNTQVIISLGNNRAITRSIIGTIQRVSRGPSRAPAMQQSRESASMDQPGNHPEGQQWTIRGTCHVTIKGAIRGSTREYPGNHSGKFPGDYPDQGTHSGDHSYHPEKTL